MERPINPAPAGDSCPQGQAGGAACEFSPAEWMALRQTVVRYIERRGSGRDVAEDIAQECLARLLHYTGQNRPASVYALVLKMAANALVDRARGEGRFAGPVDHSHACHAPLPDAVVDGRQQLQVLKRAIGAMPVLRREVLMRRRIDGQSHARIAADLGLSTGAVEKHVTRGLADLRRAMEERAEDMSVCP